jgi:hypothetical protein
MEKLLLNLGPLALLFLSLRLGLDAVRAEAGFQKSWSKYQLGESLRLLLASAGAAAALGAMVLQPSLDLREVVAGRPLAVGLLLLPIFLLLWPLWSLLGREWGRLSTDRRLSKLPEGEIWGGVWVEVGSPVYTNLVLTDRGIALAVRGGLGLGCAPVAISWGEFTSYRITEENLHPVLNVALLDGLVIRIEGPVALPIAEQSCAHRLQAAAAMHRVMHCA